MEKLFNYISNPTYLTENENLSVIKFFKLLLFFYLLLLPASGLLIILQIIEVLPENKIDDLDNSFTSLFLLIFIAPLLEELTFRLPLRIKRNSISISLSLILVIFIKLFLFQKDCYLVYLLSVPIYFTIYFILLNLKRIYSKFKVFWTYNIRVMFYLSAMAFGLSHLFNYKDIYWWMLIASPLITLPYIVMGLFLGYIRMNYGFIYSLLFHAIINFFPSITIIVKMIKSSMA